MNPVLEVGLVMQRELRKSFRSIKGIFLLVITLLGGLALTMLQIWGEKYVTDSKGVDPMMAQAIREAGLKQIYGDEQGTYLAGSPNVLLFMLNITVLLSPLLIALLGFDAVASDLQHRAVRFFTVRTRRESFYVGKMLGTWSVVAIITFVLNVIVWVVASTRGGASFSSCITWGLRFWAVSLPLGLAWCGIASLVGSQFKLPILSLLSVLASFFVLWLLYVVGSATSLDWLRNLYPNFYDGYLLSPKPERFGIGFGVSLAFAAATTSLGAFLFARRDV